MLIICTTFSSVMNNNIAILCICAGIPNSVNGVDWRKKAKRKPEYGSESQSVQHEQCEHFK